MSTSISIVEYDEISSQIDTVKETANFLPDVSTDEGYQKSKRVSLDIGKLLTALEKTRKEQKAHFIEGGRQVDIQAKSIVAKLEEIQIPHKEAYKELDNLKKQREEDRKSNIRDKTDIINIIENLNKDSDFDFEEFTTGAKQAVEDALKTLNKMQSRKEKEENDAEDAKEQAAKEAEEVAKRESNKKHIGKIRREAKDCLIACGLSEEIAKEVVLAIHKGNIKNVQIKY
ncbi:MAG: hypothetical protein E2O86_04100 [Bacteroidetes bacterium]|nr:MAG: hypothetical protein E2O86_04100 [Bacteroidota bacterium]